MSTTTQPTRTTTTKEHHPMMTTTTPRAAEHLHEKRCLAAAMLAAVENLRDDETLDDFGFRIAAQQNGALEAADQYLADGLMTCRCGPCTNPCCATHPTTLEAAAERFGTTPEEIAMPQPASSPRLTTDGPCPWPSGIHNVTDGACTRCGARVPTRVEASAELAEEEAAKQAAPAHVMANLVEILEAAEGEWEQGAPGTNRRQILSDGYGNDLTITIGVDGAAELAFRWAVGNREERMTLNARGGATRLATVVLALAAAPAEDSAL